MKEHYEPTRSSGELLTPSEAAQYLSITTRGLRLLVNRGLINAIRISPKLVRYRRSAIDQALDRLTTGVSR